MKDISRLGIYLAGQFPPYFQKSYDRFEFVITIRAICNSITKDITDEIQQYSKNDADFFDMCLNQVLKVEENESKEYIDEILRKLNIEIPNDIYPIGIENNNKKIKSENYLIIEDGKGRKVWENFLNQKGIKNISILISDGATNNIREESFLHTYKATGYFKPKILRILDRDGLSDEYTTKIKNNLIMKYKDLNYNVEFLDVNEIENYILLNPTFEETNFYKKNLINDVNKFLEENFDSENFETAYRKITNAKLNDFNELFGTRYGNTEQEKGYLVQIMKSDKIRYINGKEIIKSMNKKYPQGNLNPERFLERLQIDKFSENLNDLLEYIKLYFKK